LVVVGILQKSKVVRVLVLVCAWLATVSYILGLAVAISALGLIGLIVLIPLALSITTIWGLSTAETKAYFGAGAIKQIANNQTSGRKRTLWKYEMPE